MRYRVRKTIALIGASVILLAPAACSSKSDSGTSAGDHLKQLQSSGRIVGALTTSWPVEKIAAGGQISGVVPDIAVLALRRIGIKQVKGVDVDFSGQVSGLLSGRWDMVIGSLSMTPERCKQVLFANPIIATTFSAAALKGHLDGLTSLSAIGKAGAKVGIPEGSFLISGGYLSNNGIQNYQEFPTPETALAALKAGRIDVFIHGTHNFSSLPPAELAKIDYKVLPDGPHNYSSVAFRPEDKKLANAFNAALRDIIREGKYEKILKKYNFDMPQKYRGKTRSEACAG